MEARELLQHLPARAAFAPDQMVKVNCFRSVRLLLGLNCFEPGQAQKLHAHAGADKFYLVLSGKARFVVGDRTSEAGPGDLILAPAGVAHGVERAVERTVVLVGIAPAPHE
jgi:quercetin dioxygenase-like cupin family protein